VISRISATTSASAGPVGFKHHQPVRDAFGERHALGERGGEHTRPIDGQRVGYVAADRSIHDFPHYRKC